MLDSQRAPLLGGRDGRFQPIVGEDPPTAGCGLCRVGLFQTRWIKHWLVSTVGPSYSWSGQPLNSKSNSIRVNVQFSWPFTADGKIHLTVYACNLNEYFDYGWLKQLSSQLIIQSIRCQKSWKWLSHSLLCFQNASFVWQSHPKPLFIMYNEEIWESGSKFGVFFN